MKNTWTHTSKVSYSDNRWLPPCFMSHHVAQYTPYGPFMYNQIQDEGFFRICGLVDLKDFPLLYQTSFGTTHLILPNCVS